MMCSHNRSVAPALMIALVFLAPAWGAGSGAESTGPVFSGPELDYQPAILRVEPSGDLMIVFERIDVASFFGDLYVTRSNDNGSTWSSPQPAINSSRNERHPALVQLDSGSFALFYLVDATGTGSYRIHRASSPDGISWTDLGAIDLGWATPGEINPCVIAEADGSLTMTYHRLSGASYIARSTDGGATWDTWQTQVSFGNGALPRLAKRESDGLYLVTYQVGASNLDILARTSTNPYDWRGPAFSFSTAINSHDSQPIVLEGGTFLVTYAQQVASVFDIYYRTSDDGEHWSDAVRVTSDTAHYDTQPHPLRQGTPGKVILAWSHQEGSTPYVNHDVWVNDGLAIPLPLWLDGDTLSASTGGSVLFSLDGGASLAGRVYILLGSVSGTSPGTPLPGGAVMPLNRDGVTDFILARCNTPLFAFFCGKLDGSGRGAADMSLPFPLPLAVGMVLHFAFTTVTPFDFQSNPVAVEIVP